MENLLEYLIYFFQRTEPLQDLDRIFSETIEQTRQNVVKKQALTYDEMEQEREEEVTQLNTESDEEEQQIYNPLKLPMGWDGKPIPYWLCKLYGLGQEFKCDMCGNYSYWGIELLRGILRNGVISMGCVVLVFLTPSTSTRSHQLRFAFSDSYYPSRGLHLSFMVAANL
ncbi:hypothetical protein SLEP1_g33019 [Rubroshorea leprosula]|uniref:Splicing factor SF3a60 /Prp9 subunit C-terminal domain-containing protein n=1 Tax=Rubroshorea leprosula TaxID=152421 RepID=A0AAV5KFB4_9ROSI|nr:hypothetical protein SLEP1_g33019 [Rubroshorea leprosula]